MGPKTTFAKLQENFRGLFLLLKCADCGRKIDLQSKCFDCQSLFCTECLFQTKKTKMCKQCKSIETIKPIKDRNEFIDELLELIRMFDTDTGMKMIKEDFFNVETAENLERIFEKEKTNVFNQQKFIATSTPNINNLKKVAFNSDITMIPQNAKETNNQIDSIEKSNPKKKSTDKSNSKRKADSMNEKSDESSRSKKAKIVDESSEDEIPKENEVNNEKEIDKKLVDKQSEKQTNAKKNSRLQIKEIEDNQEIIKKSSQQIKQLEEQIKQLEEENRKSEDQHKQIQDQFKKSEDKFKQLEENNKQINEQKNDLEYQNKQIEIDYKQMIEKNKELDEKIRWLQMQINLEEKSTKVMQEQLNEQMNEINKVINVEKIQDMIIVGLTKIVSNTQQSITSSIEFDQMGKIDFTIQPFKVVEPPKKKMRSLEVQTDDEKFTDLINAQKEKERLMSSQSSTKQNVGNIIQKVVDEVVDSFNGELKECNGEINEEFDESLTTKETKNIAPIKHNSELDEISSDELKRHVDDDNSLFEDDSEDEVAASSPIFG